MRSLKGIVLCAAFWLLWAPTVSAQPQRPSEFFIEEFTFGLLGGLVGGADSGVALRRHSLSRGLY